MQIAIHKQTLSKRNNKQNLHRERKNQTCIEINNKPNPEVTGSNYTYTQFNNSVNETHRTFVVTYTYTELKDCVRTQINSSNQTNLALPIHPSEITKHIRINNKPT